ncbi:alpha/beta fold hydrolase [Bacillus sp. S/N-304-OC-R1]|uniref:alpha/beta fold hydrolase n=1 Tax=Bacillus sp. S/N-304-OC-R1 TaxID=2758034 RepID=UPI001C8EDD4F|nr:alpha/beta hydrolase [Bacillus sp. S/N-304-OC-R1]MBY0122984.1 alpha/beta hydrolase [Bacillus sp. S/N-304-OC-R1]
MAGKLFRLKDGRQLGYIEYGQKDGIPVLIFHGTPGSKIWFTEDDEIAKSLGVRLIATDRPGFGTSDRKINRSLADWAFDIQELADGLGIDKFSVIGVSGGGAFAAACAYQIPARLHHVSMIASVAPFINGKPPKTMVKENRLAFTLSKYVPWLMKYSYKMQKKMMEEKPEKFIQAMKRGNKHLIESDRKIAQNDAVIKEMKAHLGEALRLRVDGPIEEVNLLSKPWGFDLNDISIPVHIWHGEDDRMAPFEEIKKVAKAIPKVSNHFIPGAGHFLTDHETIWEEVLSQIKADYEK